MLRNTMAKGRSTPRIVQSSIGVKRWLERTPGAEEVRPGKCLGCGRPSRPAGGKLWLWGHGLRVRQQRGPLDGDGDPVEIDVPARRYRCQACGAMILVVPRGVIARRLYNARAIGLALALFGVLGKTATEVRWRVSPWRAVGPAAHGTWHTLRRWIRAIREGRLFVPSVRRSPAAFTARQVAERAALTLAALAPLGLPELAIEARVFAGAGLAR